MKLLFCLPEYGDKAGGGIATFYRYLLPGLVEHGHHVRVIIGSGAHCAPSANRITTQQGVEVEQLEESAFNQSMALYSRYAAFPGLRRHLAASHAMWEQSGRAEGYDLVEATDWGLLFASFIRSDGSPCLVQLHGSMGQIDRIDPRRGHELEGEFTRLLESSALRHAAAVQAYSKKNADFWQAETGRNVELIYPAWKRGFDTNPGSCRGQRALVVGRIQHWKGPELLCEALPEAGANAPEIEWMGRDTRYGATGKMMSSRLMEVYPKIWGKKIMPVGNQPPRQVWERMGTAKFVLVPSLWDTFNLTCAEAMGAGAVVICSTGAGASELIEHGTSGFVFDPQDPRALGKLISQVNGMTGDERQSIGKAARLRVQSLLEPAQIIQTRISAYGRIVGEVKSHTQKNNWLFQAISADSNQSNLEVFLAELAIKPRAMSLLHSMKDRFG